MWKSGEKSIQFWGKIRKKFIEMWKWAQKKVATLSGDKKSQSQIGKVRSEVV